MPGANHLDAKLLRIGVRMEPGYTGHKTVLEGSKIPIEINGGVM